MKNRDRFLFHYSGTEWKQYVEKGDAILFYAFDETGLRFYSNIERTYYKNDNSTSNTVRYEELLSRLDGLQAVPSELRLTESQRTVERTTVEATEDEIKAILEEVGIDEGDLLNHP